MREASKRLAEWRGADVSGAPTIALTPRRGIPGIIDLLAAYQHDGHAAVVPAQYHTAPSWRLDVPTSTPSSTGTISVQNGEPSRLRHELPFSTFTSRLAGRRLFAASGGSTGTHRVGEVPVGKLDPLPAAYQMTGLGRNSRMYVGGPWSHSAFVWAFYSALESGITAVVASHFRPRQVVRALDDLSVDWALLPPTEFHALASTIRQDAWRPRSLRTVVTTGGATRPAARDTWYGALAPDRVFDMFATTEGIGVLLANGVEQLERLGTSGRPVWAKVQIRDSRGRVLDRPGEVGELFMRSLSRASTEAAPFRSAGDRARIDEDGYVFLMGRTDDEVVIEGQNINLHELARAIERATNVDEAVVIEASFGDGQSPQLGVVVVSDETGVDELRRCAAPVIGELFGPLAIPRRWVAVRALPTTPNGKVDWRKLTQLLDRTSARGVQGGKSEGTEHTCEGT
ncbi:MULTISPECIES: class I adenylate-forming enzyme family protein [Streptomyces]|uniref:Fatty acid--CoA ligase family protein n=1 Tax=Streptomyces doebereineriae TaxID=3075528 RepID=A0ABU2V8I7_9ACTN|nr:fatty acid--CoA ligase family protein [Streptomyces sp. DSM 41640]MDT0481882.1 fatty acid--CoA ligase family protein [Streptomyces sp. DSM 41640]